MKHGIKNSCKLYVVYMIFLTTQYTVQYPGCEDTFEDSSPPLPQISILLIDGSPLVYQSGGRGGGGNRR
jgi:hypothetical protein